MSRRRTPAQRLAIYRAWLMVLVACTIVLITAVPVAIVGRGMHDASAVLPSVGVLLGWWGSFIGTCVNFEKLPRQT